MKTNRKLGLEEMDKVRRDIQNYGPLRTSEVHRLRFPRVFYALTGTDYLDNNHNHNYSLDSYLNGGFSFDLSSPRYLDEIKKELNEEDLKDKKRIKAMRYFEELKLTGQFDKLSFLQNRGQRDRGVAADHHQHVDGQPQVTAQDRHHRRDAGIQRQVVRQQKEDATHSNTLL